MGRSQFSQKQIIASLKRQECGVATATFGLGCGGPDAIPTLLGDERLLLRAAAMGGARALTEIANLYPDRMHRIYSTVTEDTVLSAEVTLIVAQPVIPAFKTLLGQQAGYPVWVRVRAPLEPLSAEACSMLVI